MGVDGGRRGWMRADSSGFVSVVSEFCHHLGKIKVLDWEDKSKGRLEEE